MEIAIKKIKEIDHLLEQNSVDQVSNSPAQYQHQA